MSEARFHNGSACDLFKVRLVAGIDMRAGFLVARDKGYGEPEAINCATIFLIEIFFLVRFSQFHDQSMNIKSECLEH